MTVGTQKDEKNIHDATLKLLNSAGNNRSLAVADLLPRVAKVCEKTFGANASNADSASQIEVKNFIESLHVDDLCLVIACERGDEKAWNDLFQDFGATVRQAARKAASNPDAAEDLAQSIWAELHGLRRKADGTPSGKIGYYSGRGSLAGWLRAVVAQLAIDAHRKQAKFVQVEETREFETLAHEADQRGTNDTIKFHAAEENPEKTFFDQTAHRDVEAALKKSIGELEPEDRLLLKLYYFEDLNLKQAGAILGFHEATASRRIVKIQTNLRKRVEQILKTENRWQPEEIRQTLMNAAGVLQTDLEKIVKGN